jgi:diadenosine tetraphosphate (Ap4A) HIT family hydrolase
VVAPARHVEQIDALTPDEQRGLGPLLAEVAAALRAATPCEKVYVSIFAELLPHLHVHVIARPPGLPEEERGPRLFASARRANEAERIALFRRVQSHLAEGWAGQAPASQRPASQAPAGRSTPPPPAQGLFSGPWRAVLLSAAVCPGVGQLAQKRYVPGLAMLGATLALVIVLLVKVVREALDRIPTDPAGLDPLFAFGLAGEIQRANAGFFAWITAALVLLWVISIADAWLAQR